MPRPRPAQDAAIDARRGTWLDQTTPAEPSTCPTCGEPTLTFRVAQRSDDVVLDGHDVPINTSLRTPTPTGGVLVDRCWTWHGDRLGWTPTSSCRRSWRRVRAEHHCPTRDHQNKPKNESERNP